jgi:hypothetical protein
VRYGSKPIEFEKGKAAILLPNQDTLVGTLDTVIAAERAGELDEILAQQVSEQGSPSGREKAVRLVISSDRACFGAPLVARC